MARTSGERQHFKTYSLRLREDTYNALKNMSIASGVPVSELGRQAVDEFIVSQKDTILSDLEAQLQRRQAAAEQLMQYVVEHPLGNSQE